MSGNSYAPGRRGPPAPSGSTWASRISKANIEQSPMLEIVGHWYCSIPTNDQAFIQKVSLQVAYDFGCDYVGIRSAIHNTKSVRANGKASFARAPWHFTVEFKRRNENRYMSAHVYTDTRYVYCDAGFRYVETNGLQKLEFLKKNDIHANPQRFLISDPKYKGMTRGERFERKFPADGYRPHAW